MLDRSQLQHLPQGQFVRAQEIARFDALAKEWWDDNGKFGHVLAFNRCRAEIITEQLTAKLGLLEGKTLLDIGCGGGLLCEAFARQGAIVTGIDASEMSIKVAQAHARQSGLDIDYRHCLAEHLNSNFEFDIVLNTEVIEHVDDQAGLAQLCADLVADNGVLVMATLNRTVLSYLVAIIGAEYVMGLLPKGTHDWRYFVKPQEIRDYLKDKPMREYHACGMQFNPLSKRWRGTNSTAVNYLQFFEHTG
ncbi:bifunctional 2-polyprenyl-6-hydroxyphenol methylase/3-demethylubiquinol 3-O-methyltransferase UbiG [Paraferrimonas sedimenticola]|uniref:Ubiquinone biosynthesis O-methyltransferase n=1 Tax=Paraferrimonas sedimenticola TaxID=375674 RepID=A0AA37RX93_9GAMM|nr:bifunctional 2-polyprenyl-6-hydroxyphenol methylase/3-demethylubiquinol 3-O-methyltransferase UbiG [Paraferrimonas sedimenticola]GLP96993.1 ubiquinone biosynthesis O-methyltransferase [Paraferrimonas sedimenticola]